MPSIAASSRRATSRLTLSSERTRAAASSSLRGKSRAVVTQRVKLGGERLLPLIRVASALDRRGKRIESEGKASAGGLDGVGLCHGGTMRDHSCAFEATKIRRSSRQLENNLYVFRDLRSNARSLKPALVMSKPDRARTFSTRLARVLEPRSRQLGRIHGQPGARQLQPLRRLMRRRSRRTSRSADLPRASSTNAWRTPFALSRWTPSSRQNPGIQGCPWAPPTSSRCCSRVP